MNPRASAAKGSAIRAMILIALALAAFRQVIVDVASTALNEPEAMHVWLAPLLIAGLLWRRRGGLRDRASGGSVTGLLLVLGALAALALREWAWFPEYASRAALVPAIAGVIAVAAGWRVVAACLPMLALVLLTIPPGSPYLSFFIVRDDAYTPALVQQALAVIPGGESSFSLSGFLAARTSEAMLLFGMLSMAVWVAAKRPRTSGSLLALALVALPIAAICHAIRTLAWAVLESRGWAGEGWLGARAGAVAACLLLSLGLFHLVVRIMPTMPAEDAVRPAEGEAQ